MQIYNAPSSLKEFAKHNITSHKTCLLFFFGALISLSLTGLLPRHTAHWQVTTFFARNRLPTDVTTSPPDRPASTGSQLSVTAHCKWRGAMRVLCTNQHTHTRAKRGALGGRGHRRRALLYMEASVQAAELTSWVSDTPPRTARHSHWGTSRRGPATSPTVTARPHQRSG